MTSKINILGTEYKIVFNNFGNDIRDGYCDVENKEIHIDTQVVNKTRKQIVLRHELIHAFFFEAGLENYFNDEQLVSLIAIQFDKIKILFEKVKKFEEENDK